MRRLTLGGRKYHAALFSVALMLPAIGTATGRSQGSDNHSETDEKRTVQGCAKERMCMAQSLISLDNKYIEQNIVPGSYAPDLSKVKTVDFVEQFNLDGTWAHLRKKRGPEIVRGEWSIIGHQICVIFGPNNKLCRVVLMDRRSQQVYMSAFGDLKNQPIPLIKLNTGK